MYVNAIQDVRAEAGCHYYVKRTKMIRRLLKIKLHFHQISQHMPQEALATNINELIKSIIINYELQIRNYIQYELDY